MTAQEKLHIEKDSVQETLVIPLYAREMCNKHFPELFTDSRSSELINRIDYDFSKEAAKADSLPMRFGTLEIAARQMDLLTEVQEYLKAHPTAAVVNLGCGLDQTGEATDNGTCKIYNIDFPDVIAIRRQLTPETDRIQNIGCDLTDTSWFDQIDDEGGSIFFASGVFYYIATDQIRALINAMAERFTNGRLAFDAGGSFAIKLMLKTWIKESGIQNIETFFHINTIEEDVTPWLRHADVSAKKYMMGYSDLKVKSVSGLFRLMARVVDGGLNMRIYRFDFHGIEK